MKVTATHNINVDGKWYKAGEAYDVKTAKGLPDSIEVIAESEPVVEPEQPVEKSAKRRGRGSKQ